MKTWCEFCVYTPERKVLLAYTVDGEFVGERESTREILACIHGLEAKGIICELIAR